jgi:hypothetical protein
LAANIQDLNLNTSAHDQYKHFLASLKYDEMNSRRSAITIYHEKTFGWIFDESIQGSWDNFIHWLKSGENKIYWISGEAGSGKSTLMKFIIDSEETKKALLEINTDTIVISFFFWAAGTKMQRSITGMLCTLLHRMLRENKAAATRLLGDEPEFSYKESISDWSMDELQRAILKVSSSRKSSYCFFLDGLDEVEYAEGQAELLQILEKFRCQPNIKLCVSSRPEPILQDCLKNYPKLRLQDLTSEDIRQYAADVLGPLEEKMVEGGPQKSKELLIDKIVGKSAGVFLWVRLVLKKLQTGIRNEDDWETLMKRVNVLPRDIDLLYNDMWSRLNEDQHFYRSEAAFLFNFVLHGYEHRSTPLTLFELMVASEKSLGDQVPDQKSSQLIQRCKTVENRVAARCAGLLEIAWIPENVVVRGGSAYVSYGSTRETKDTSLSELKSLAKKAEVTFIHRSARDFLLATDSGKHILSHCSRSDEEYWRDLIRVTIAQAALFRHDEPQTNYRWGERIESITCSEYVMQGFAAARSVFSKHTEFKLLDFYERSLREDIENIGPSISFLRLAARYGHYEYVRSHIERMELPGSDSGMQAKTRLLHSTCIWLKYYFSAFFTAPAAASTLSVPRVEYLEDMCRGQNKLISWLLEQGADPNLTVVGRNNEYETPFISTLKTYFNLLAVRRTILGEVMTPHVGVALQKLFEFNGDLRATTLFYGYRPDLGHSTRDGHIHPWYWDFHYPVPGYPSEIPSWKIVVQVNCSWLLEGIIAKLEVSECKDEKQILESKCYDVKPEFKILQVFSGDTHLSESGLREFSKKDPDSILVSPRDRLMFKDLTATEDKASEDKITSLVTEAYGRSSGKLDESIENWKIREGYASANEIEGQFERRC